MRRVAQLAACQWATRAQYPSPVLAHHAGRPSSRDGRELAAGPARAHAPEPGLGGRHHRIAAGGQALVLPGAMPPKC